MREVRYDPYQLVAVAQRLTAQGLPMIEFPQSVPNLTEASTNLYELMKGRNLISYADEDLRLAISRCVALETSRGWRIAKEKASHKIDVVVALAQAALGAVQLGQYAGMSDEDRAWQRHANEYLATQAPGRSRSADDRLYANGEAFCEAEDRAATLGRVRGLGSRWRRSAW